MHNRLRVHFKLYFAVIVISLVLFSLLFNASVFAIARGYASSDTSLQTGMIVALSVTDSNSTSVERATLDNVSRIVGIVTTVDNSLVSVSSGESKVLVESEGQVEAYVSDINGPVNKGDLLILSPLKGVLMKQGSAQGSVLGIAVDTPSDSSTYSYQNGNEAKNTQISKIVVNLNNKSGNNIAGTQSDSALAKLGRAVSGKEVSEIRVLVALILFVIVLIAEGAIIYGAVSSAIVSIGRNPLGRKIINEELIKVMVAALTVMMVGLVAVFVVLRI